MVCLGLLRLVRWGFSVFAGSFPSCLEEKHHNSKSGQDLDQDKPVCIMSCQASETDPNVLCAFILDFHPRLLQPTIES